MLLRRLARCIGSTAAVTSRTTLSTRDGSCDCSCKARAVLTILYWILKQNSALRQSPWGCPVGSCESALVSWSLEGHL